MRARQITRVGPDEFCGALQGACAVQVEVGRKFTQAARRARSVHACCVSSALGCSVAVRE